MECILVSDTLNVTLFDSGDSILVSVTDRKHVELAITEPLKLGATLVQKPEALGSNWTASCQRAELTGDAGVATLGSSRGRSRVRNLRSAENRS